MENSQVPWQEDVPYEDLVKKCPYLSRKSVLTTDSQVSENPRPLETVLTKSKKKRLKKRLKLLSLANKSPSGEGGSVKCLDIDNTKSTTNMTSPGSKSVINDKAKSLLVEKEKRMPDSHKGFSGKLKKTPDIVDGEILQCNTKVNSEQIVAEREAKKKAKHLAKQQTKEKANSTSSTNTLSKQGKCLVDDSKHSVTDTSIKPVVDKGTNKNVNTLDVKNDSKSQNQDLCNLRQLEAQGDKNVNNITTTNGDPSKPGNIEKKREDVIAEREAKKKAKQLAKLNKNIVQEIKTNDFSATVVNNKVTEIGINQSVAQDKNVEVKSKAELRAERRAKQEAQRAAKEAEKRQKTEVIENKENNVQISVHKKGQAEKDSLPEIKHPAKTKVVMEQRIKLFSHLHLGQKPSQIQTIQNIHPLVLQLGLKYSSRVICGSNSRCVALLACLKEVIRDYTTPLEKEFSRGLESKLAELTNYLNQCRPISVSMTNALRHIKSHLTQLPNNVSDEEAKRKLLDVIDTFIREQIDVAGEAICESVTKKIANGDVILTYSSSSLLYRILIESHRSGKEFSVVVVDGGPWFEGREMLRKLVTAGLNCTYVQVSAINFIMKQATKVLLGAHALLANGSVMSRAGTALIALAANSCNVPVLVCCETYKFCERVQTDSFVYNELGSPDDLAKADERLSNWQSLNFLSPLSIVYDITPPDLVTAVVTELAILPCTSVPVILRIKPSDVASS